MTRLSQIVVFLVITGFFGLGSAFAETESLSERFAAKKMTFGVEAGAGWTIDIPSGRDRSDLTFTWFFPNLKYNLTGLVGESWYRGAVKWHVELGFSQLLNRGGDKYLVGFSPLMLEYSFLSPERRWAPNILGGGGFALTNFDDVASRELGSEFQFLLHLGAGLEYFHKTFSSSINYRYYHISNAGIEDPNIGLNAHVISLGFNF